MQVVKRSWRGALMLLALLTTATVPAMAAPAHDLPEDLPAVRERLGSAQRELAELEALVQRTADEVSAIEHRLTAATTELARIETELAAAQQALAEAQQEERRTAAVLAEADRRLAGVLAEWSGHRDQLEERAVAAYKRGHRGAPELFLRGVTGASDWHEVAVTVETVNRMITSEHVLAQQAAEGTQATAAAREEVTAARAAAVTAQRDAAAHERDVQALLEQQQRTVAEIDDQLEARRVALETLENDAAARTVLVRDLERRVAELELAASLAFVPVNLDLDPDGPAPPWAARLPAHGQPYASAIEAAAAQQGLDGRLLAALVWTESNFRPDAVSHAGAIGLAQLMPGTARGLGVDPWDPHSNLVGGARYLRTQLNRFGRVDLALAAYNAGPGRVTAAGNQIPNIVETQLYVVRVLERYERLRG